MKILVFDSNSILNRAFYGIRLLTAKDGSYTNAVYGFFNIALKLIDDQAPDRVGFAFDLKAPTFRHQLYAGYKAHRKGMPPELAEQLPLVKEAIRYLGYPILECEGYEADDILGTIAREAEETGDSCLIATGDRDALQLVREQVTVILAATRAGGTQYLEMTPDAVREQYGVEPAQLIETKALMGDSSDDIPGVAGIGEKTAFALIQKYGTVEKLYAQLEAGTLESTPSVRAKLEKGREMAFLSRRLGEICCHAPVDHDADLCCRAPMDAEALYRLFSRLELHSLIKRLALSPPAAGPERSQGESAPVGEVRVLLLTDADKPAAFPPQEPLYIAGRWTEGRADWLLLLCGRELYCGEAPGTELLDALYALPNPKRFDDSKPFYKDALSRGREIFAPDFDFRLAGYLLSPNSSSYALERLCGEYGIPPAALCVPEGAQLPGEAAAAACMPALWQQLSEKIAGAGMDKLLHEIEMPLAEVLADMENVGFLVDVPGLAGFGEELRAEIARLEAEIYELAGHTFNIQSPKQLGTVLFEELGLPTRRKTKSGYSTDAEVLESLIPYHGIVSKILEYRKYTKLCSTYVDGLTRAAGADSRIRTSFNQTETRTGRISSLEPNMQNIPIRTEPGSRMRSFFAAAPGSVLVDADYSQIELRVLAAMAGDETMIRAFAEGEDIHRLTASQVFDMPPLFVTPLMRSRAKAVNFGIVYGISAFSLAKDIGVSVAEADRYIKQYLETYRGVRDYLERAVAEAKRDGFAHTLFGRRRALPELRSDNYNLRAFGERVAKNMPIQGTAADIIKIAMVRVYRALRQAGLRARLILQVHDELIVECPESEAQQVRELLVREMTGAVQLAVPMEVDAKIGKNWDEAH